MNLGALVSEVLSVVAGAVSGEIKSEGEAIARLQVIIKQRLAAQQSMLAALRADDAEVDRRLTLAEAPRGG